MVEEDPHQKGRSQGVSLDDVTLSEPVAECSGETCVPATSSSSTYNSRPSDSPAGGDFETHILRKLTAHFETRLQQGVCAVSAHLETSIDRRVRESHDGIAARIEDVTAAYVDRACTTFARTLPQESEGGSTSSRCEALEQECARVRGAVEKFEAEFANIKKRQDELEGLVTRVATITARNAAAARAELSSELRGLGGGVRLILDRMESEIACLKKLREDDLAAAAVSHAQLAESMHAELAHRNASTEWLDTLRNWISLRLEDMDSRFISAGISPTASAIPSGPSCQPPELPPDLYVPPKLLDIPETWHGQDTRGTSGTPSDLSSRPTDSITSTSDPSIAGGVSSPSADCTNDSRKLVEALEVDGTMSWSGIENEKMSPSTRSKLDERADEMLMEMFRTDQSHNSITTSLQETASQIHKASTRSSFPSDLHNGTASCNGSERSSPRVSWPLHAHAESDADLQASLSRPLMNAAQSLAQDTRQGDCASDCMPLESYADCRAGSRSHKLSSSLRGQLGTSLHGSDPCGEPS